VPATSSTPPWATRSSSCWGKAPSFRHGDDADFDAELELEQRVRAYARGRIPA
jgi:hypothetical protein